MEARPRLGTPPPQARVPDSEGRNGSASRRDGLIAEKFRAEAEAHGIAAGTPGIMQLGAAHAADVPFHGSSSTTAELLANTGWRFASACVVTTRAAGGVSATPPRPAFG